MYLDLITTGCSETAEYFGPQNIQEPRRKRLQLMDSVDSDVDGWNSAFLAPIRNWLFDVSKVLAAHFTLPSLEQSIHASFCTGAYIVDHHRNLHNLDL